MPTLDEVFAREVEEIAKQSGKVGEPKLVDEAYSSTEKSYRRTYDVNGEKLVYIVTVLLTERGFIHTGEFFDWPDQFLTDYTPPTSDYGGPLWPDELLNDQTPQRARDRSPSPRPTTPDLSKMARRKAETTTAPKPSQAKRGQEPKPKDATARARSVQESRRALAERGGRLLQLRLEPEAAAALDEIQARTGGTLAEAVSIALLDAKYVLDLTVRLTAIEAEALATVRTVLGARSDRDAIAEAVKMVAQGMAKSSE